MNLEHARRLIEILKDLELSESREDRGLLVQHGIDIILKELML